MIRQIKSIYIRQTSHNIKYLLYMSCVCVSINNRNVPISSFCFTLYQTGHWGQHIEGLAWPENSHSYVIGLTEPVGGGGSDGGGSSKGLVVAHEVRSKRKDCSAMI